MIILQLMHLSFLQPKVAVRRILFLLIALNIYEFSLGQLELDVVKVAWSPDSTVRPSKKNAMIYYLKWDDTTYEKKIYRIKGSCYQTIQYKEKSMQTKHGRFCDYDGDGVVNQTGEYVNNLKDGIWYTRISGKEFKREKFENGIYKGIVDTLNEKEGDSLQRDTSQLIRPQYPGGKKAKLKFITTEMLNADIIRATDVVVVVCFRLDTVGNLRHTFIWQSFDKIADDVAIQIIDRMPPWIPGRDKCTGEAKSFMLRQPLTWVMPRK